MLTRLLLKRILPVAAGLVIVMLSLTGEAALPNGFTDGFDSACEAAVKADRRLLLLFTGSDWCPDCQMFERKVLQDPRFAKLAQEKYELVYLDYPRHQRLPLEIETRNDALRKRYDIHCYPTVLITDASSGEVIVRAYYHREPNAAIYLARLDAEVATAVSATPVDFPVKGEPTVGCQDGVCAPVVNEIPLESAEKSDSPGPRIAHGLMSESDFLAFLGGSEQTSPFVGRSTLVIALLILLGGMLLNLTPCVLPMIPVNLLIIGRSFRRACVFAVGLVLGYGLLGVAASLFGFVVSDLASSPAFGLVFAGVLVVLALAQFGVFDFHLLRRKGFVNPDGGIPLHGVFVMGLVNAVFAGACIAPVLVAVMALTAERVAAGESFAAGYPFLLGLGLALPWPFVGAGLKVLPKPGSWMTAVNRILGVLVLLTACWYGWQGVRGLMFRGGSAAGGAQELTVESFDLAKLPHDKPVLVDCWASWCKNCGAMNVRIARSVAIQKALEKYHVVRLQAEDLRALRAKPGFESVKGLPAFLIFE